MKILLATSVLVATALGSQAARPEAPGMEVDLLLVLAADVSGSMNRSLRDAQRRGFASAFREKALRHAVGSGPSGAIAVAYFEWSGPSEQRVILPWTRVANSGDMERVARTLETAPHAPTGAGTSISGALLFAADLLDDASFHALRKVVDVSGNGRNDSGHELSFAHSRLKAEDTTVNGLVLSDPELVDAGPYATMFTGYDGPLDEYYRSEVIAGPGAFMIRAGGDDDYGRSILRKMVLEVASTQDGGHPG